MSTWESLSGSMLGVMAGGLVACIFLAGFLRVAAAWTGGLDVPYGQAVVTMLLIFVFGAALTFGLLVMAGAMELVPDRKESAIALLALSAPFDVLIGIMVIRSRLAVSFGLALAIMMVMIGFVLVLGILGVLGVFAWTTLT